MREILQIIGLTLAGIIIVANTAGPGLQEVRTKTVLEQGPVAIKIDKRLYQDRSFFVHLPKGKYQSVALYHSAVSTENLVHTVYGDEEVFQYDLIQIRFPLAEHRHSEYIVVVEGVAGEKSSLQFQVEEINGGMR